jgi:hypothetical protein
MWAFGRPKTLAGATDQQQLPRYCRSACCLCVWVRLVLFFHFHSTHRSLPECESTTSFIVAARLDRGDSTARPAAISFRTFRTLSQFTTEAELVHRAFRTIIAIPLSAPRDHSTATLRLI